MRSRTTALAAIAGAAWLLGAASGADAKPAYRKDLAEYFGPLLSAKLNDCATCHTTNAPGEPKFNLSLPKPHNAFGARLMAVGEELRAANKRFDIPSRLDAIAREDADKDGVSNVLELLTGHQPGVGKDRPTAAELQTTPKKLASLAKLRGAYAWRPFEPVQRPAVPKVKAQAWVRNPIDSFIAAEHEARGLKPRPEAAPLVLLRRVYLDLTGLPPTREEQRAYLADHSANAYEKVVDRLLASPRYGERWGRHWMDVWRYSDWDGYGPEVRNSQPHIWRWRDWIVDSLNADKGYDRMVQEMLAGDELAPDDPKVLPATGFLVRNWYKFSRHETLNKTIEGTTKAFLGLTLNCARCHDHKFDPLSQKDYYSFRAIFEPQDIRTDRLPGQADITKDGLPHAFDAVLAPKTFLFFKGDDRKPDESQVISPALPAAFGGTLKVEPVTLPLTAAVPDKHDYVIRETLAAGEEAMRQAKAALAAAQQALAQAEQAAGAQTATPAAAHAIQTARDQATLAELASELAEAQQTALQTVLRAERLEDAGTAKTDAAWIQAATEAAAAQRRAAAVQSRHAHLAAQIALAKAQSDAAGPASPAQQKAAAELPAAQKKLAEADAQLAQAEKTLLLPPTTAFTPRAVPQYPRTSTGRRLALARWITDQKNPLAARVAMNHLWVRHFGEGLVPSVFDFGANGQKPSHPALLDWLASEFMHGGTAGTDAWSMKRMHRLMLTSSAYRMASTPDPVSAAKDPDNRYLWRWNSHRMEAEAIRDSVLAVSGQLDLTAGGPELDQGQGLTSHRRSLYFRHSLEKQVEILATFDQASVNECYARTESIVPQQALALANSSMAIQAARVLAGTLWKEVASLPEAAAPREFIASAFAQVLGRPPTPAESAECERFLTEQTALLGDLKKLTPFTTGGPGAVPPAADPRQRARESLVQVLLNHNDFVTIR